MPNPVLTPPELDPRESPRPSAGVSGESHEALGIAGGLKEEGVFASLISNVRDVFFPVKQPPLVLTSQPVAVPDRMKVKRSPQSTAVAVVAHVLLILLIWWIVKTKIIPLAAPTHNEKVADVSIAPIIMKHPEAGGGGGGNTDKAPATQGKLPPPTKQPLAPMMKPVIEHPKIEVAPALADVRMQSNPMLPNFGDPNASKVAGPTSLGNGGGGGIGGGTGGGLGPGRGGGEGGGDYIPGRGGVSNPVLTYSVDAEFTDAARRIKFQGEVLVAMVVDIHGIPQQVHVVTPIGMGLDENAVAAVKQFRFKPSMKDGKPVPVRIQVQVGFHVY